MTQKLQNIYLKVEKFSSEKPLLFWLITLLLTSIPFLSFWKYIKAFLDLEFTFKGYEFLLILLTPFAILGITKLIAVNKFKRTVLRELISMKKVLDNPFKIERRAGMMNMEKYIDRYYHSEIVEFFDSYNNIVQKLRKRHPKSFGNLKSRNDKPNVGKDWVHMTDMQVIKTDIELLIDKLK